MCEFKLRLRFADKFNSVYEIDENKNLIDESVSVYAIKDDCYYAKINFYIFANDGKQHIVPIYDGNCDYFYLIADRFSYVSDEVASYEI